MNWFRPKPRGNVSPHPEQRQALLAAAPLLEVGDRIPDDPDTPQSRFHAALAALAVGDRDRARAQLRELLAMDAIGSRLQLQAWSCLRELGEPPPAAQARAVQGVVVDRGERGAVASIAAYADRTAVVLQADGEVLQWAQPDCGVDDAIEALLTRASSLLAAGSASGPCDQPPADGHALLSVLTFGGVHARIGSVAELQAEPACAAVLRAADRLANAVGERCLAGGE